MRAIAAMLVLIAVAPGLCGCERFAPREQNREQGGAASIAQPSPPVAQPGPARPDTLPAEVAAFAERRTQCDHFRGEEAYDAERGRFLAKRLADLCTGTDDTLAALKKRHAENRAAAATLAGFEESVE